MLYHNGMKKIYITIALIALCIVSCNNYWEAMRISKKFSKEYSGLDTLIRLDGYYYREDSIRFMYEDKAGLKISTAIFSKHHGFNTSGYFNTHEAFHNQVSLKSYNGSYILSGDTIKARSVSIYDLMSYNIFSEQFLIINDTTLMRIWFLCETSFVPH